MRLEEVMTGRGGSYILPFLWLKGEKEEIIREELESIASCGIREVCLESRPHPDFMGLRWWSDLEFIIQEARKREMRVWILDDSHFPTGYAAGAYETKYPEKAKWYLAERHMDVVGPAEQSAVWIQPFLGRAGRLLAVLAFQKPDGETQDVRRYGARELTDQVRDGMLYLDIPEGRWRIFVLYTTQSGGGREHYMNLIDTESVRVLLDSVYEPHYRHFQKEFGGTIAGFFSDEPELGNVKGYGFEEKLGKPDCRLPWSQQLRALLEQKWGREWTFCLPALWYGMGERTGRIRFEYMDAVTRLVAECFTGQVGKWCEEHGVEYIGHVIEDDNAHTRLGCGTGHYFREQSGQHRSGVDVVHFQIMPGFEDPVHRWIAGERDGEFFHYGLAKLGASEAHINPNKKGRVLCELFGNYSWGFGVSEMKWLTDHMLVRGINHFVPHAFSMRFPDPDCPPHFYARGNNPQFPHFIRLMKYMNRMCHLLSGGNHVADAAILYHAQAEWSGGETMPFQKPARRLMEKQLDYDVISEDWLMKARITEDKRLRAGNGIYPCLIVPYFEYIEDALARRIGELASAGLPVYMIDMLPEKVPDIFRENVRTVYLEDIAEQLRGEIVVEEGSSHLRLYRYRQNDGLVLMWMNESVTEKIHTMVRLPEWIRSVNIYDGETNTCRGYAVDDGCFPLELECGQSALWIGNDQEADRQSVEAYRQEKLERDWRISIQRYNEKMWKEIAFQECFPNINGPDDYPDFSGVIRYETEFEGAGAVCIGVNRCYDPLSLWINDEYAGSLLRAPGSINIEKHIRPGRNHIRVEVANTLVWALRDPAATHMQLHPTGLLEAPVLFYYDSKKNR